MNSFRKKYLVLGANGLLGKELVSYLKDECVPVAGPHYAAVNPGTIGIDITDPSQIRDIFRNVNPQIVINAAACSNVDWCEKNKDSAFELNSKAVGLLAEACNDISAKLVHLSTDYVFDGNKRSPYTENDEPNPISCYGRSKLDGEIMAAKANDHVIARTAWLFGIYRDNFVANVLAAAVSDKEVSLARPDQVGCPTYTKDSVTGLLALIEKNARGLYHVVNTGFASRLEYARKILQIKGLNGMKINIKASGMNEAQRPDHTPLDNTKYVKVAGASMRRWEEALEEFIRFET